VLLGNVKLLRAFDATRHSYSCWATTEMSHLEFLDVAVTSALLGRTLSSTAGPDEVRHRNESLAKNQALEHRDNSDYSSVKQFAFACLGGILASVTSDRMSRDFDPVSWQCLKHLISQ
jgi:hypothetical protein